MNSNEIMQQAADWAAKTSKNDIGGPFGAAIVRDGEIISLTSNTVLRDKDATCHAETNAIRVASKQLGTHDLSGCEIYATGAPCPMCLSAIIWANIKKVYISGLPEDAAAIGFRDEFIFDYIKGKEGIEDPLEVINVDRSIAQDLYAKYAEQDKIIY